MIDLKHIPTRAELKYFGLIFAGFFGLVGAFIGWRFEAWTVARVMWVIGGAVGVIYYLLPAAQPWIYRGWIYLTFPISWVMSHLILGAVYYLILTPIGLIMRMLGHDPMRRKIDRGAATYWIERKPSADASRYFKQY